MAVANTPELDLIVLPTHNIFHMAVGDGSTYPEGYNISTPTLEITPPGHQMVSLTFVAGGLQIYNNVTLGIGCSIGSCTDIPLPDGIYLLKYSIYPSFRYFVEKKFLRVEQLYASMDTAFLKLDLTCSLSQKKQDRDVIDEIEFYIQGAISAANQCATDDAISLYKKAKRVLDSFISNRCYLQG